ncbi:mediator of RNA polymerase II transcription subunit 7 [Aspergillus steynii IBT 23096]|uniref:Mediator of RNA polymerase II transcription subunit 7 n=1 Tax=Aspergillus steynii IBT 23096 TaxID=1392250 RepID=A0A2I2G498_9EURO|nr:mediator of RNA polymerase II transcription subunit 7 [Aspergillus steynii IBT 23096]PLB47710.1 mediator of RNA polymerase II transcription subunit 7 [Aspergillus steynii IBT 23096]
MAEAGQQRALTTAFAPPPPLWKHFTPDNVKKFEEIKKEASKDVDGKPKKKKWSPTELRSLDLPGELHFLAPPEIPTTGQYSVFGELQNLSTTLPPLKDQGIEQLYPEPSSADDRQGSQPRPLNHAHYLLRISKSLLLNFLEFVGILSVDPEQFQPKVEDLRNLFINAHHLLNLYRPHQARESLILMMEEQLSRSREEIQQMDKLKAEITDALDQLEKEGANVGATEAAKNDEKPEPTKQSPDDSALVWKLLDEQN